MKRHIGMNLGFLHSNEPSIEGRYNIIIESRVVAFFFYFELVRFTVTEGSKHAAVIIFLAKPNPDSH